MKNTGLLIAAIVLAALSGALIGSAQLVTAQTHDELSGTPNSATVHVDRLSHTEERTLLLEAYPDARLPDSRPGRTVRKGRTPGPSATLGLPPDGTKNDRG